MANSQRFTFSSIVIVLLLLVGGFFAITALRSPVQQAIVGQGVNVNSISVIGTDLFRINMNLGGAEVINATISPAQFKSFSGTPSEKPFTISAKGIQESVIYTIQSLKTSGEPRVYDYAAVEIVGKTFTAEPLYNPTTGQECPPNTISNRRYDFLTSADKRICITKTQKGLFGKLSQPTIKFEADLVVSNGQTTLSKRISDQERNAFFDSAVQCSWSGSLVTGDPAPVLQIRPYLLENSRWEFTSETLFQQYTPFINDREIEMKQVLQEGSTRGEDYGNDLEELESLASEANSAKITYLDPSSGREAFLEEDLTLINPSDSNFAQIHAVLGRKVNVQQVVCDISASYVGIVKQVGQPKLNSLSCPPTKSGNDIKIALDISNTGNAPGTFAISKSGCEALQPRFTSLTNQLSLNPNQRTTFEYVLTSGTANVDTSQSCDIKVTDIKDPSKVASGKVSCTLEKATLCAAGAYDVREDAVFQCNAQGSAFSSVLQCDGKKVIVTDGMYKCEDSQGGGVAIQELSAEDVIKKIIPPLPPTKEQGCPDYLGFIPNVPCRISNFLLKLGYVLIALSVLAGFGAGYAGYKNYYVQMIEKRSATKKDVRIAVVLGIIIALLAGYLTYVTVQFVVNLLGFIIFAGVAFLILRFAFRFYFRRLRSLAKIEKP